MAWSTPRTWGAELVTVAMMNQHIRDNLNALKTPPSGLSYVSGRDYMLAGAGAWTAVDTGLVNGALQHTVSIAGTQVVVRFQGSVALRRNDAAVGFNISVNGTPYFPGAGIAYLDAGGLAGFSAVVNPIGFNVPITGLTPGSNTFRLDWSGTNTAVTLYGSGTVARYMPIVFGVFEIP